MEELLMSEDPGQAKPVRRRWGAWLLAWAVAATPLVWAAACLLGLAEARNQANWRAALSALLLIGLPAFGLARIGPKSPLKLPIAAALWSIVLLLALPGWFPGEVPDATHRGLAWLLGPAGERWASASVPPTNDRVSPPAAAEATRVIADPPMARTASAKTAAPTQTPPSREKPATVILPYEGDQTSLRIPVDFDGPALGERFEMIFDTGATFTTLDHASLKKLGIRVEANAPWITLRTASGEIEAPLVLVDAVWLGDAPVEWVTVAVCDTCANPPVAGLLGLNVSGRFRVSLDHDRNRIELAPRRREQGSALGISHWLDVQSRAVRYWDGEVEVNLLAKNRAPRTIAEAVIDLSCGEEAFAIQIDDIPAGGETSTEISLPRGTDCSQQTMRVSRGHWQLDRF